MTEHMSGLMAGCGLLTWVRTDRVRMDWVSYCHNQVKSQTASEERPARSTSPSLLTATVGQRVLSRLDDGAGRASPEQVVALWTEEGIRNGQEILQTLDFSLEDRLSLADLTLALDNELLVSGNGIHQAALISYKNEIQQLQEVAEQACRERDKFKADLDVADQRNLQLVREVDDRHASMETLNESRIRDLELEYRDRLTTLRCQSEQDSEALLQQVERERQTLREELHLLRAQEAELREELCSATQENCRLEEEVSVLKIKLDEAESSVVRLKGDLKLLLHDKYGGLDPTGVGMSQEERFSEVIREYELKCRELRDRNDELRSELELLKSHRSNRKWRQRSGDAVDNSALSWNQQHQTEPDDSDMKRHSSPEVRKKLQPDNKAALSSLDHVSSPEVSIQTELALEQLKQKHQQELQELNIQLETQVNYYERSLEKMRQSMEVERKDISQSFKLEISEVEEQKSHMEREVKQLKEALDHLQTRIHPGGGGWSSEHERRMQRERAEMEQNFAREISNLVQRLSGEKDQLEAEMKLKLDQEVQAVRTQQEGVRLENVALQERLSVLQQEVQNLEDDVAKKRRRLEEAEREHESSREEEERLHRENSRYREEVLDLSSRNLQLSNDNSDLSARLRGEQESVQMLRERLATVSKEQEEAAAMVQRMQDAALQQQKVWTQQKELLDRELSSCKEKLDRHSKLEVELNSMMLKLQRAEQDQERLQRDTDNRDAKVEQVQQQLVTLETEAERLRSQLHAVSQEKLGHAQEANELQRKLRDALNQVEQLEGAAGALARQEEELRVQNQELQRQLNEVQKLNSEQQDLKTRLDQAEAARTQAQDQVLRANATLSVVQAQHLRRLQQLQEAAGGRHREEAGLLQARLDEEMRKSQQLEEALKLKVHQSNSQMSMKQGQYEKAMAALQQRVEQLEVKLKAVRVVLQEKVQQLKDQVSRSNKASGLLKQLYVENSELMKALQITEQRQKLAEKKSFHLEEKVSALTKLLRDIVPAALAT